jgi:O-succinylbenzoate synthase
MCTTRPHTNADILKNWEYVRLFDQIVDRSFKEGKTRGCKEIWPLPSFYLDKTEIGGTNLETWADQWVKNLGHFLGDVTLYH